MKAHHLLFENLIDINPRTGMIKLNDRRMVLTSVEAIGILRRDLVNTLGMDRAKGFLMRYGWACGFNDGETMEKIYEWSSKQELLLAGPYLHTLEGIVTGEPDIIEFDENELYFTGEWKNSFEADEHVSHYGHSKDPVCWILIGYTSGYLTKTFGKEVLVYEETCKGKGDGHCYFVAKTVDPVDDHHQQDLRYYKSEELLSELDRAYKEVQELNENIIESEQVQKQLTDMLLEGKNVSDTVELISNILQKSIIIDYFNQMIEGSFIELEDQMAYELWNKDEKKQVQLEKNIETFPIQAHNVNLGRMVVIGDGQICKKEKMIIQRALMVCTVQMFHQRELTRSIWKKKEHFFEDMINHKYDEDWLKRHMYIFDFNPNALNRILTIKIDSDSKKMDVLQYLSIAYPAIDVFIKGSYIILILSEEKSFEAETFSSELEQVIQEKFKCMKTYIGVGREARDLKVLAKSFQDACSISDFIQLAYPAESRNSYFEELEPIIMFLKGVDQEELIQFCKDTIGKLVEYDEVNQGNLVMTLKSYLDYNGNLQQTADDLHLSITGLRYRLERIESFCNTDLKTGTGRFKYQLAVRIYFAMQIINERSKNINYV